MTVRIKKYLPRQGAHLSIILLKDSKNFCPETACRLYGMRSGAPDGQEALPFLHNHAYFLSPGLVFRLFDGGDGAYALEFLAVKPAPAAPLPENPLHRLLARAWAQEEKRGSSTEIQPAAIGETLAALPDLLRRAGVADNGALDDLSAYIREHFEGMNNDGEALSAASR